MPNPDPLPATTVCTDHVVMWHSEIVSVVEEDIGASDWKRYKGHADARLGQPGGASKNSLHIAAALAKAWEEGKQSEHLDDLCQRILKLGQPKAQPPNPQPQQPVEQPKVMGAPAQPQLSN